MIKKNYIILSLMLTTPFIFAGTPDVAQLADLPQQEVNAKVPSVEPAAQSSAADKIKTVIKSCGVGIFGLWLGLGIKAMQFNAVRHDPQYGTLLNALAGLVLAKCGSSAIENVFDKFQSNIFVGAMAFGYIVGDDAPHSHSREVRAEIDSSNQKMAQNDFLKAQIKSDSEMEESALNKLSTKSIAELIERQRLIAELKSVVFKKASL